MEVDERGILKYSFNCRSSFYISYSKVNEVIL